MFVCSKTLRACAADFYIYDFFKSKSLWTGRVFAGHIVLPSRAFSGLRFLIFVPLSSGGLGYFEKRFYFLFPTVIKGKTRLLLLISAYGFDLMSHIHSWAFVV